ncbi:hypothetical protein, partial [Enterovibrio norvegicus]|uniref:hypothetical protein n=1 Tax=Enterovibrio norvegicus TaxID=188144 RepID=UPI001A7E0F30
GRNPTSKSEVFSTPAGRFRLNYDYEPGYNGSTNKSHRFSISIRTESGLANHRLRRIGVTVPRVSQAQSTTFNAVANARNYERKP